MNRPCPLTPRIHIVGRRNAGKTTLVCDLVRELSGRNLRIGTVKHTHHTHELDTPGKDSWKHRDAGAAGVGILTPHLIAAFVPSDREHTAAQGYERLSAMFADCDLLVVEGDLRADGLKLEVWRAGVPERPYAQSNAGIHAVISDDRPGVLQKVWPRSDVPALADRILQLVRAG